jgi:hypothetical protein
VALMSYFDMATTIIAEIGAHGDYELPADEFNRDDRTKRIDGAASALCDFVAEHLRETEGGDYGDFGIFKQEHLPRIARMIAIGMMAQFEDYQEMEGELVASIMRDNDKPSHGPEWR